jgi:DNA polymerase-1
MEQIGIQIDPAYCREAMEYYKSKMEKAAYEFENASGIEFVDSNKVLAQAFDKVGEIYPTTEKGNPSFTDKVLQGFTSPLAEHVKAWRDASKKSGTYFANFLYFKDDYDRIHATVKTWGTDTARFSYADPNLQNIPKEDSGKYKVRAAFTPTEGFFFAMLDYDQQEYRLLLDLAGEDKVIDKVLAGLDVHQATADLMGVDRTSAKTLNFMLLYGGGAAKLADALGVSVHRAKHLKASYFQALPNVKSFTRSVIEKAEENTLVKNWAGRNYNFPGGEFSYKAPNHIIQGGCAEVMRLALVKVHEFLKPLRSRILVSIHDEILFEIAYGEEHILSELKRIMESVYPYRKLPLTCGIDYSKKSWADKEPWDLENPPF